MTNIKYSCLFSSFFLLIQVANAELLKPVANDQDASYYLDVDSIKHINSNIDFSVRTIHSKAMIAPNNSSYTVSSTTFLANCTSRKLAITGVQLYDTADKPVFTNRSTVEQVYFTEPKQDSILNKILKAACSYR